MSHNGGADQVNPLAEHIATFGRFYSFIAEQLRYIPAEHREEAKRKLMLAAKEAYAEITGLDRSVIEERRKKMSHQKKKTETRPTAQQSAELDRLLMPPPALPSRQNGKIKITYSQAPLCKKQRLTERGEEAAASSSSSAASANRSPAAALSNELSTDADREMEEWLNEPMEPEVDVEADEAFTGSIHSSEGYLADKSVSGLAMFNFDPRSDEDDNPDYPDDDSDFEPDDEMAKFLRTPMSPNSARAHALRLLPNGRPPVGDSEEFPETSNYDFLDSSKLEFLNTDNFDESFYDRFQYSPLDRQLAAALGEEANYEYDPFLKIPKEEPLDVMGDGTVQQNTASTAAPLIANLDDLFPNSGEDPFHYETNQESRQSRSPVHHLRIPKEEPAEPLINNLNMLLPNSQKNLFHDDPNSESSQTPTPMLNLRIPKEEPAEPLIANLNDLLPNYQENPFHNETNQESSQTSSLHLRIPKEEPAEPLSENLNMLLPNSNENASHDQTNQGSLQTPNPMLHLRIPKEEMEEQENNVDVNDEYIDVGQPDPIVQKLINDLAQCTPDESVEGINIKQEPAF